MDHKAKTAIGLEENIAAVFCYVFGWISGVVFLFIEKENKFVRFHALQSVVVFMALFILSIFLGIVPVLGLVGNVIITPLGIIIWLWLMYKAYQGERYEFPIFGRWVSGQIK